MELTKDPQRITHAADTAVQSTGYGEGRYGVGPYGGTARARVHTGPAEYEEFLTVAQKVRFPPPRAAFLNRCILPSVGRDVILSVGEGGSVHKIGYGHNFDWAAT